MSTALVPVRPDQPDSAPLVPVVNRAEAYARAAKAPATRKAYASDWRHFQGWCDVMGLPSLPAAPETVALYIAALAEGHRPATISRRMAAIAAGHKARGFESPASMRHGAVAFRYGTASGERMAWPRTRKRPFWWKTSGEWSASFGRASSEPGTGPSSW